MMRELASNDLIRGCATSALLLALAASAAPLEVMADVTPQPPASLCIDDGSGCPDSPGPTRTTIKWYPGHYVINQPYDNWSTALVDEAAGIKAVTGIKLRLTWKSLEPTRGNYDFGNLDRLLAYCKSKGLRVFAEVQERNFGGTNPGAVLPAYLANEANANGGWYIKPNNTGVMARLWVPAVMDRYIALQRALAARYDSNDYFAAIGTEETAPDLGGVIPSDYTQAGWAAQLKRFATVSAGIWVHTPVMIKTNSLSGQLAGIINHSYLNRVGVGGPDVLPPPQGVSGDTIIRGVSSDTASISVLSYLGKTSISYDVQTPELGGKKGAFSPTQLADFCVLTQGCNFMSWVHSTGTPVDWPNDIKPYLAANPRPTVQACPENFKGGCVTN